MRYCASEKLEIIRLVEQSALPVRRRLEKIGIPRASCAFGNKVAVRTTPKISRRGSRQGISVRGTLWWLLMARYGCR